MKALILVDIQNDYLPAGVLAVPDGDAVISVARRLGHEFPLVVATQDWFAPDHLSFASQHANRNAGESIELAGRVQTLWPDHCVRTTRGAELADDLQTGVVSHVFRKGTVRTRDSYSGFFDAGGEHSTGLGEFLKDQQVADVFIMGLATDYCVLNTALDAIRLGFYTTIIADGCRGVELIPGDTDAALARMREAGAEVVTSRELLASAR